MPDRIPKDLSDRMPENITGDMSDKYARKYTKIYTK